MDEKYYRTRAWKRIIVIVILIVVVGTGYWFYSRSTLPAQVASFENSAVKIAAEQIAGTVSNPPPLVATDMLPLGKVKTGQFVLTRAGVILQTNTQRKENGKLSVLGENGQLDTIATLRMKDMFAKQYFAHVSPASSSALTVAKTVGYQYIALGENLALGNFKGDGGVVTAWMNSPGHRENILNTHYTQIGVGVGEGIFNGQDTWIAVQVFGRPASDCPSPDQNLKSIIDAIETQLSSMLKDLEAQKAAINVMQQNGDSGSAQAVDSYNALVGQYNTLATQEKQDVAQYNAEVSAYNLCIQQ